MSFDENNNVLDGLSDSIDNAMEMDGNKLKSTLERLRIDPLEEIQPPQTAWSIWNETTLTHDILGTLGNFSAIIGKAKSRKSFFINIAVSSAISQDLVLGKFKSNLTPEKRNVLYFDTEQSKYHVQLALKRICQQVNILQPDNLEVFGLRSKAPQERLELIEYAIYNKENLGFVVIDGIKDLITSINDEEQATMIVSKLLKWTEERNIHVLTVLHQNKSDNNARGHIGTELVNKAETVLSVSKAEENKDISIVEPQQCRNKEPEVFAFEIIDNLPCIAEDFQIRTETRKNKADILEIEDYKKYQILQEVYTKGTAFSYGELKVQVKLAFKKLFSKDLGMNRTIDLITDCKNRNWLIQEKNKAPYTLGNFSKGKDQFKDEE
jgi:hypothetical protein